MKTRRERAVEDAEKELVGLRRALEVLEGDSWNHVQAESRLGTEDTANGGTDFERARGIILLAKSRHTPPKAALRERVEVTEERLAQLRSPETIGAKKFLRVAAGLLALLLALAGGAALLIVAFTVLAQPQTAPPPVYVTESTIGQIILFGAASASSRPQFGCGSAPSLPSELSSHRQRKASAACAPRSLPL